MHKFTTIHFIRFHKDNWGEIFSSSGKIEMSSSLNAIYCFVTAQSNEWKSVQKNFHNLVFICVLTIRQLKEYLHSRHCSLMRELWLMKVLALAAVPICDEFAYILEFKLHFPDWFQTYVRLGYSNDIALSLELFPFVLHFCIRFIKHLFVLKKFGTWISYSLSFITKLFQYQ